MAKGAFLLAAALSLVGVNQAAATLIFQFNEVGGDVQLVVSGSIDLDATLGFGGTSPGTARYFDPFYGTIFAGDEVVGDFYDINSEPTPFGGGRLRDFDVSSGDRVGLGLDPAIVVPLGYVSGTPLLATGTFLGETFVSLGMTPGSYVTEFLNGQFRARDSIVVNVGDPIPEPGTLLLLGSGIVGLVARRRRAS